MGNYSPILLGTPTLLPFDDSGNADTLIAWQAVVAPKDSIIETVNLWVQADAGNIRVGIYDSDGGNGLPGTLLAESASTSTAPPGGAPGWLIVPIVQPMPERDMYWIATLCDNNGLGTRINDTGAGNSRPSMNVIVAQAFGALPDPFPLGGHTIGFALISLYAKLGI